MISLNDYLYNGDTVLKILHNYEYDLRNNKSGTGTIDLAHADYLRGIVEILEHNDFLTSQSQRIRGFYKYMVDHYPNLAFTFKGRIKSLIRAEEKFNRNIIDFVEEHFDNHSTYDEKTRVELIQQLLQKAGNIKDLIAYRIIISVPKCHIPVGKDRETMEQDAIYEVAEKLPFFLMEQEFQVEESSFSKSHPSRRLSEKVQKYYKDFIEYPTESGYQSLHIVFLDQLANCKFEIQLRTKAMDDYAEIGVANHTYYEQLQKKENVKRKIPKGVLPFYDEAYERLQLLQELDLAKVDVNMFTAINQILMNDGCGLFRGRLILPYEHLSRFQNDLIE